MISEKKLFLRSIFFKKGINFRECILKSRDMITHDTSLYIFDLPSTSKMQVPIGYHIFLRIPASNQKDF